jgi:hypothetical protein
MAEPSSGEIATILDGCGSVVTPTLQFPVAARQDDRLPAL